MTNKLLNKIYTFLNKLIDSFIRFIKDTHATTITSAELKMLYIEVVLIAIVGIFLFLYNQSPITQTGTFSGATNGSAISSSDVPWSTPLVDETLGLPIGYSAIIIVSSIFLIPMTIMNTLTLARLAKDFLTQWV